MTLNMVNPDDLGRPRGWSHGMLSPPGARILFVAGMTAPDRPGFVQQFAGALDNVLTVVREAGGSPTDVGRLTIYTTDLEAYESNLKPLGEAYRERMGRHFPAMALVEVKRLVDPKAMVEIEATAAIPAEEA
ncbi:MAG TPA: RidA family protein [Gemmatimonadota bacterium]|nr:RidA family protein [Gemmatimonadota bacterium]